MEPAHEHFMQMAVDEAETAAAMDEVPVGAVIVDAAWNVLASARNETISRCDPSAHAEMLALRLAARNMENYRLLGTTLYATVEPCVMCMGAAIHARVSGSFSVRRIPNGGPAVRCTTFIWTTDSTISRISLEESAGSSAES
jgi:tRNA(Arg) A34 adenosine deaminase TadA